jgi:hypothetical protein
MMRRTDFIKILLAVVAGLFAYSVDTHGVIASADPFALDLRSMAEETRSERATAAAESAASATWLSAYVAGAAAGFSMVGLVGLWFTFRESTKTSKAALAAVETAREANAISRLGTRAWMIPGDVSLEVEGRSLKVAVSMINAGSTPAIDCKLTVAFSWSTDLSNMFDQSPRNAALTLLGAMGSSEFPSGRIVFPQEKIKLVHYEEIGRGLPDGCERAYVRFYIVATYLASGSRAESAIPFNIITDGSMKVDLKLLEKRGTVHVLQRSAVGDNWT